MERREELRHPRKRSAGRETSLLQCRYSGEVLGERDWELRPVHEEFGCLRSVVSSEVMGQSRVSGLTAGPRRPWSCALILQGIRGRLFSFRTMLTTSV